MSESKSGLNTPFDQSTRYERKRLHLGVCGSVACYKAADLLLRMDRYGHACFRHAHLRARAALWLPCSLNRWALPLCMKTCFLRVRTFFLILNRGNMRRRWRWLRHRLTPCSVWLTVRRATCLPAQALAFDGPMVIAPAMNPRMWANPCHAGQH